MTGRQLLSFTCIHSFIYLSGKHLLGTSDAVAAHVWRWGKHTSGVWADDKTRSPVGRVGRLLPSPQSKGKSSEGSGPRSFFTFCRYNNRQHSGVCEEGHHRSQPKSESSVYRKVVIFGIFRAHWRAHVHSTPGPTNHIWNHTVLRLIPRFAC